MVTKQVIGVKPGHFTHRTKIFDNLQEGGIIMLNPLVRAD